MQSMTDGGSSPRSPRLSFLFSAILPGTGQLYNGSQRGYVYLAVEAMAWFARVSYKDAADRKEADFRAFADRQDLGVSVEAADGVFLYEAVAAVDLDRLLGGPDCQATGDQFCLGGGEGEVLPAVLFDRGLVGQEPGGLDL